MRSTLIFFLFQAEDGIREIGVTGVQTCALPIFEAVQVQQAQGVAERLEAALNQGSSRPVEVINGGVAAYGTGQELLLLDQVGAKLQPDLVLLLFFVGNDVTNNDYRLELWGDSDREKLANALKPC